MPFSDSLTVRVLPTLPPALKPLEELAKNFWWTWHPTARGLFIHLDGDLWRRVGRNPVRVLREIDQNKLAAAAADETYVRTLNEQAARQRAYLAAPAKFPGTTGDEVGTVAYFSAEFGVHESLPIYSGGLGVLAGDHLKAASDHGLPLVAVGLLYRNGYFDQSLSPDGWQQESYPAHDFAELAVEPALAADGKHVQVEINLGGFHVFARVWRANVGRVPLYLLDTDVPENSPDDRAITAKLYGTGSDTRIRQEIVLGIGGVRALKALGVDAKIFHMNEGHSAFLALERVRTHIEATGHTFDQARQHVMATNVFTTHTPVPAGIDRFTADLMYRHFREYWPKLKLDEEGFLALGREDVADRKQGFSMAVLAIRLADTCNGVSKLHGEVSRDMWGQVWPGVPKTEVPITSVTNGVHLRTWISTEIEELIGDAEPPNFSKVAALTDSELWSLKRILRQRLITYVRNHARRQLATTANVPASVVDRLLDPDVLTIGFARRFATYKRGTLLFRDLERLKKIVTNETRPIQFIFAGKAHPADNEGKALIQAISKHTNGIDFRERMVFVDNYDMEVARHLVQGVDVWLNNPRRPHEASGTSGMKAAANGVPNCSILDGWWVEAYAATPAAGWAIGTNETLGNDDLQDKLDADALYDLLEHSVAPAFYTRGHDDIPAEWMKRMRPCFTEVAPVFSTGRMVGEYAANLYAPALRRGKLLAADKFAAAAKLSDEKDRVRADWHGVNVTNVRVNPTQTTAGQGVVVQADVSLGGLAATDVKVQLLTEPPLAEPIDLKPAATQTNGRVTFTGDLKPATSGQRRLGVRVVPNIANQATPFEPGLIRWA
ncbi:MAG: alpha-glucan family phosphorylase [Tepidisphaeraceae bacterium]